jgi:phage terminase Nu1 subunit (DNA packaging protein)
MLLTISDRALSMAQRANERAITHLRLRVRAWQLALDPETKAWIAATKKSLADGDLADEAMDSAEAVRRLEEARRDLTA